MTPESGVFLSLMCYNYKQLTKGSQVNAMIIKLASIDDAFIISHIHALSWKSVYKGILPQQYLDDIQDDSWVNVIQDWMKYNVITVQIAYDNDVPMGCIAYGRSRDDGLPHWGEIVSLYFIPDYMGKGYGNKLMDKALFDMLQQGFKNVYLWVLEDNIRAQKFYEKNGFICSEEKNVIDISGQPFINIRYTMNLY